MSFDQSQYSNGYDTGRLDIALSMATAPVDAACSASNYVFNAANAKRDLTGAELIALRQLRMRLQKAVATLDEVIAPASKLKLVAAE